MMCSSVLTLLSIPAQTIPANIIFSIIPTFAGFLWLGFAGFAIMALWVNKLNLNRFSMASAAPEENFQWYMSGPADASGSAATEASMEESQEEEIKRLRKELEEAKSQLILSDKMATLGVLTAGIAHEINNPVNYIAGSIGPLRRDIADLLELQAKYRELKSGGNVQAALDEIRDFENQIELIYILEEIGHLLTNIEQGAYRTREIVNNLRNYSRTDDTMRKANLQAGLDSTLRILESHSKDRIEIIREYSEMQEVECRPGQINQVFMNILYNAMQAIDGEGTITIKAWGDHDKAHISIKDSGHGMTEEVKAKIFSPFFTTKKEGVGTGLGLSICNSIIANHQGSIVVNSEIGDGAEFLITLPVISEIKDSLAESVK